MTIQQNQEIVSCCSSNTINMFTIWLSSGTLQFAWCTGEDVTQVLMHCYDLTTISRNLCTQSKWQSLYAKHAVWKIPVWKIINNFKLNHWNHSSHHKVIKITTHLTVQKWCDNQIHLLVSFTSSTSMSIRFILNKISLTCSIFPGPVSCKMFSTVAITDIYNTVEFPWATIPLRRPFPY